MIRLPALVWVGLQALWRQVIHPLAESAGEVHPAHNEGGELLAQLAVGLPEVVEANRTAIGEAWPIACDFVDLHFDLLRRISRAAGSSPSDPEQAVLLLGAHALNTFISAVGGTVRGEFDTTLYLVRAQHDMASLLVVCSRDTELARSWQHQELSAADARRRLVKALRDAGEIDLAETTDSILRKNADAANDAAHASLIHADKLLRVEDDGSVRPIVGGQANAAAAMANAETFLGLELQAVTALASCFVATANSEEQQRLDDAEARLRDWRSSMEVHAAQQESLG